MRGTAAENALAREASRGDERALGKIYRDYHQPLYRFCLAIVGDPQDAQDALQNTMVKMLRALPGEKRSIALKPWLYRIAHNESVDLLRRRRPDVSLEASESRLGEELATHVETRQRLRQLIADLSALPERQRETLLMREAGGLSFDEIGFALETSPAVARQTLYEARLGLRQMDAGREMECEIVTKALSDGDGRVRRRRDIRAHLRDCGHCRRFAEEIDSRANALAAISPLPAVAAAAMLQGLLGGGAVAGAGGIGGVAGGIAVKSVGTATLLKGVAAVAVVAAIGIGGADRAGLIQIGGGNSGSNAPTGNKSTGATGAVAPSGGTSASSSTRSSGASARRSQSRTAPVRGRGADRAVHSARGASRSASAGDTAASEAPTPTPPAVEHPHGRGHIKQTPAAAAHGQETAASHKPEKTESSSGSEPGSGKSKSAEHPAHPTHPATPATSSPPAAAEPESKSPPGKPSKWRLTAAARLRFWSVPEPARHRGSNGGGTMDFKSKIAVLAGALALVLPSAALAQGVEYAPAPPEHPTHPAHPAPGPKASLPEKAKAYGVYCRGFSKKHVKGEKGTPFSRCVTAMAKATTNDNTTTREACRGLSKKHVEGAKGTPFSRCVVAAARAKKAQGARSWRRPVVWSSPNG